MITIMTLEECVQSVSNKLQQKALTVAFVRKVFAEIVLPEIET